MDSIAALFQDIPKMEFAIRQYCVNCVAHRLCKFGWEPQVNWYEPRMLLLLGMCMPGHTRMAFIMDAWQKATVLSDKPVLEFLEFHFQARLEPVPA